MKITKKQRTWLIIGGSLLLVLILVLIAVKKEKQGSGIKVSVDQVQKRTVIETVSANGKIQPELDVKISPYISGEVVALYVKEGDKVKKGDLLAKIDPQIYIAASDRMEAALNSQMAAEANAKARVVQAEAQFTNAQQSYDRNKKLFDQNVISQSDWDAATSSFQVAKAEVEAAKQNLKSAQFAIESAKASVDEANENLTKTTIAAPSDGTVSKLSVETGERVTGASQFSSGTEIMRIANLQAMEVNVEVNENDIVRVALGDTSLIEVDAYLGRKFKGIVTEISTSANTTGVSADQVTNFNVKILILSDSYQDLIDTTKLIKSPFRPGMSATVDIQTERAKDVLTVPIQSVTTRSDTTGKVSETQTATAIPVDAGNQVDEYVFLYDKGKAKMQKVTTGIQDNSFIQIEDGLTDGEEVITGPYRAISKTLKNGDDVQKVDVKDLFKEEK